MIKIVKANKSYKNINKEMSKLLVDSYYDYFKIFNMKKEEFYKSFNNVFDMNKFYVVLLNDELIGIGACGDGSSTIKFKRYKLILNFGLSLGNRIYKLLKTIFEERDYAFEMDDKCGMIEFVAVKDNYKNRKVGSTLINHIMYDNDYSRYLVKIGDNNYSARKLLDNIGFEVFDEESATGLEKKELGIEMYLYMIRFNPKYNSVE